MVMIDGHDYTSQEAYFYNQGGQGRQIALQHYEQRMRDNPPAPAPSPQSAQLPQQQKQNVNLMTSLKPAYTRGGYSYYYPPNPIEHSPIYQWFKSVTSPKPSAPQPSPAQQYTGSTFSVDLKKMVSEPAPASGSYQSRPGGEIKVATQAQQADLLKQGSRQWIESHEVNKTVEQTPYLKELGYKPAQGVYVQEIADVSSQLSQQQEQLSKIQNAQIGTTFTIGDKPYTKEEATAYYNKNIKELSSSKEQLQKYQEAGWEIKKTNEGYSFEYPKASEVYTSIHGKELSGVALTSASFIKSPLAIGTLASGIQYAITGDEKVRQAELESLSEFALGLDISIKKGDYIQKIATSPAMIEGVYLPVALMTGTAVIGVAGKGASIVGSRIAGTAIGSKVISGAQLIGTKLSPITRPLISVGTKISTTVSPYAKSFVGKQAIKYGAFGAMAFLPENPVTGKGLYKTITEAPEQAGSALGQSLFGWEVGWGAMKVGGKIPQQLKEINIGKRLASTKERLGLRPLGEEATQPLPGAKRLISTKGMTEEERFAFEYKQPAQRITPEERELDTLARSMDKKKPSRFQEFIKSEEGAQPILPGQRNLIKSESTAQPLPGAKQYISDTEPKNLLKSEGQTEYFAKEGKETIFTIKGATIIEEKTPINLYQLDVYPKPGGKLEIGELVRTQEPLNLPPSWEKTVTRVGKGTQKDVFSLKIGGEEAIGASRKVMTGKPLDIIEVDLYKPSPEAKLLTERTPSKGLQGELLIEEYPRKSTISYVEFKPDERTQIQGLMTVRRVTPVSTLPYPGEGAGNLYESMPGTKAEAIKSQELIYKPYDISTRPVFKTQGEVIENIQSYYGKPAKGTSLTGAEPVSDKGVFALDTKAEESIFKQETIGQTEAIKNIDAGKMIGAGKKSVVVNVRGQKKIFTGEQLRELGKGELKARPQRFTEEQLKKAVYSPGASPEYFGKQLRKTMRVKTDTSVPVGTRPETGWAKYLGERQEAKIFIERPKEVPLPKLESEVTTKTTVIPRPGKTSLRFPKQESVLNKKAGEEIKPFTVEGESIGKQAYIIERQGTKGFEPSGLYESPDLNTGWSSVYAKQPAMKEVYEMEKGTGMVSSRWERIKPGGRITREPFSTEIYKTGMHLLSGGMEARPEGEGLLTALGSTFLGKTKPGLIDKEGFGEITNRLTGLGELNEPMQGQPNINDFMNKLKYIDLTRQGSRQAQRQASLQATKQLTDQIQEQDYITDQATIFDTGYDTIPDVIPDLIPDKGGDGDIWRPPPPRKKKEEPDKTEYIKERMKEDVAYDVYVKERGMYHGKVTKPVKFIKVTRQPVNYEDALSLGGQITDTTSAVSFRVKQVKQRPTRLDRPVQNFTSRSHKFKKQGETFIEKPSYRMDSPGELQQVSALGQQERRRQGLMNKSSSIFSIRTPRSRATGLLSPMTKLKETRLFKKKNKKGERKNAYI